MNTPSIHFIASSIGTLYILLIVVCLLHYVISFVSFVRRIKLQ